MSLPTDNSTQLPGGTFTSGTPSYDNVKEWSIIGTSNLYNTSLIGNVGIGTSTLNGSKLNIIASTSGDGGTNNGNNSLVYIRQTATWNANQQWALYVSGYSYLGGFRINAADGIRALFRNSGQMGFAVGNNSPITFTQNNSTEIMRINDSRVSIGTTDTSTYKLNVNGSLNSTSLYQNGTQIDFSSYATNTNLTNNYYNQTQVNNITNTIIQNNSNFTLGTSNILRTLINTNLSDSSNYTTLASNIIIANNSNFTLGTSNILRTLINTNLSDSSNYALNISNVLLINYNSLNTTTNTNISNYASNISNVLLINTNNLLYTPNYTAERPYPSKLWNSIDASTTTITYNGLPAFRLNFVLDTTGITYGSGTYTITFSNKFTIGGVEYGALPSKLFDYITNTANTNAADFLNTAIVGFNSSGDYIGERYLAETSYKGEWFYITLPNEIYLTKIAVIGNGTYVVRNPALWRIYGSNDGILWEEIIEARQSTRLVSTDYTNNSYTINKILSTQSKLYKYIGMNINAIISGQELSFIEFQIFGKEFINYIPIYATNNNLTTNYYNKSEVNTLIGNTSNYALNVSNIIIANNSNFTLGTSNILRTLINTNLSDSSNYTTLASNIIIANNSNFTLGTSNILRTLINTNLSDSSNYTTLTSNIIIANNSNFTLGTSNILRTLINTNLSSSSNYAFNISNIIIANNSNFTLGTSNIIATNINTNYLKLAGGNMSGSIGFGTSPDSKIHIATPDNIATTTNIFNFKNVSGYGIYATSTSITARGNTLDFLAYDYNSGTITTRNLLTLLPSGNIGIDNNNGISSKLTINNIVNDRWTYDHSTSPLTITNQTGTGTTLNDPLPILNLCRQGVSAVSYGARTTFKLCRYENSSVNSRTRLDIVLAHNRYDEETSVMSLRSDGNVGIGSTNPGHYIDILNAASTGNKTAYIRLKGAGGGGNEVGIILNPYYARTGAVASKIYAIDDGNSSAHLCFATAASGTANEAVERMRIKNDGNVGIGINNANCRLYISANLAASATVYAMRISSGASTDAGGFGTLIGLGSEPNGWSKCAIGHTRMGPYDTGDIIFLCRNVWDGSDCTMSDEKMRLTKEGQLKITSGDNSYIKCGPNTNNYYLNVGATSSASSTMYDTISGGVWTSSTGALHINPSTNNGIVYINFFNPNAFLSVGGAVASAKLHVGSGTASTGNIYQRYISVYLGDGTATQTLTDVCAIFESSVWTRSRYTSSSDERIKKNIQDINDNTALQKILLIQPKTYEYIDKVERGTDIVYGFIAQQIKEVIPEAISIEKCVIPNIFKICKYNNDIISLLPEEINKLKINDEIEIIIEDDNNKRLVKIIEINDIDNTIKINESLNITPETTEETTEEISEEIPEETNNIKQCFVYGSKVDDFHTLDKNYIYTLNVCATQELYKLIQQLRLTLAEQQERISILETRLN